MMKLTIPAVLLMMIANSAFGQDDEEFKKWMKAAGNEVGVLRKSPSKSGPEAVASAEKISGIYEQATNYFTKRQVADAVKWSQEGKLAADELAVAAKAGDTDKSEAAFKKLGGTCRP